ncbi:unnamed protein product [Phaedon cochleariae]|uniref:Serpin domain-containing protein n=1 Tax=Phaedon cochleariae TaxID=80249 RepID=A0A9P0GUT6_PHACE|nr:unnamed protein product [Phaedon cochleariae]
MSQKVNLYLNTKQYRFNMHQLPILLATIACVFAGTPLQQLASGNQRDSANLYRGVARASTGNLIFCPVSAEIVLSLLTEGAAGPTKTELIEGLSLPPNDADRRSAFSELTAELNQNSSSKLLSANRIFIAPAFQIERSFEDIAVSDYRAGIENINFADSSAAAHTINQWVEDHTNNRIQNLISPDSLSGATRMILVNTLYLKGNWARQFKAYLTQPGPFFTSAENSTSVDMMHAQETYRYKHCNSLKAKFLKMDFEDRRISMTFVLPDAKDGLGALENRLEDVLAVNVTDNQRVSVTLPRFSIQSSMDLKPILQQNGIRRVFDPSQANLTGISSSEGLYVDFVVQKAWINVTETGVEAAAATAVGASRNLFTPPPNLMFIADHPFIFFIRHASSNVLLFLGRYSNL